MKRLWTVLVLTPDAPSVIHRFNTVGTYLPFIERLKQQAESAGLTFQHGVLCNSGGKDVVALGSELTPESAKQARHIFKSVRNAQ